MSKHPEAQEFEARRRAMRRTREEQEWARQKAARQLATLAHPAWSPAADFQLLDMKASGLHFHRIAQAMSRKPIAVEQRWHRLRAIEGAADFLVDFGLSAEAWPEALSAVLRGAGSE